MRIAPQGFRFIVPLFALALGASLYPPARPLAVVLAGLALFVVFFFRDPTRVPPADASLLVSPGDGTVVSVETLQDGTGRKQVAIFLSIFNVHINRSPLTSVVSAIRYTPGKFLAAYKEVAGRQNERNELELRDADYVVLVRQIAGVVARRIVCSARENDHLERGQRIGLIQFGSRMEIVLPGTAEVLVAVGDKVKGGATAIARRK